MGVCIMPVQTVEATGKRQQRPVVKLLNAIPASAIPEGGATLEVKEITWEEACRILETSDIESYIGHEATARVISKMCGKDVPVERREAKFAEGEIALVFALNRRVSGEVTELKPADFRIFKIEVY